MNINNIKTGDVFLSATESWLGRIIRKITKSQWSHTGIFVWLWGELFVIEAESHGIQLLKWSDEKYNNGEPKNRKLLYLTPKVKLNEKEIAMTLLPYVGTRDYDYIALLEQIVYQYTGKWLGKKQKGDNKFYCSEFVAFIYNKINSEHYPMWWSISPGEIYNEVIFNIMK